MKMLLHFYEEFDMSDEIKVNSELPQKLATLGQVKDALDKRDEKIGSLKEDL